MKFIISVLFLLFFISANITVTAQNVIEWDGIYQLSLSDFRSPTTAINGGDVYSLFSASTIDFGYQMTNAEFAFTKHFNDRVKTVFKRDLASLVAPDSALARQLLSFAQYEFDLAELHARKLRKRLYEEKKTFSNPAFFQTIYDEVQAQLIEQHVVAGRLTDLGRNQQKLQELRQEVLKEIELYNEFCKMCKPAKKHK
jgi:hypothetical protein